LQYKDAVTMLRGLQEYATVRGLEFGVKITNTFPVKIEQGELPGEQMYMSGRALYPLSLSVAQKLSHDFGGKLAISYSGGADAFNITELFKTGICPITVCTTILKPGGYVRTAQMAGELQSLLASRRREIDTQALDRLVKDAFTNKYHQKKWRQVASRKIDSPLGLYDCFSAPCKDGGCPIDQDIPEYLYLVSEGRYDEAFEVIAEDNANPAITGAICNHHCQNKCVRVDYESPLAIRAMKLEAVKHAQDKYIAGISPSALRTKSRVAVIGAGPAGISAALFLRRNGVDVTVFEQREKPFGMVSYVIPEFRISADLIAKDFELAVRTGVNFKFGVDSAVNLFTLQRREGYDYVIIATGAWGKGELPLRKGADRLVDALEFLEESKAKNCAVKLGKRVAVIGGGDVAMDCARAAKRAPGVEHVSIVYRRTKDFMPAEPEELAEAEEDGVSFDTLLSPLSYDGKTLNCEQMELGERDSSGRRSVKGVGKMVSLEFDTVISAVGAKVDTGIFTTNRIALDDRGGVRHNKRLETGLPNVYVAGDAKSGPSTIVKAIADAKLIATDILKRCGLSNDFEKNRLNIPQELLYDKKGVLVERKAESAEGTRCLGCDQLCEICVDVCPNRANVAIFVPGAGANAHQILHIDGMCNECGNCGTFCPHKGDPYKDKLTLFWTHHDFNDSTNAGFLLIGGNHYKIRTREGTVQKYVGGDGSLPREFAAAIAVVQTEYKWMLAKM
ncbi:MAG: putative selenate reductase subunit YgfK, partial [Defluviitaleaceae bacterium]|nr:putative selenate reductase subunit YgfK [Defluviitaleaceae bacterium]